jgi:hypothetical protein
VELYVIYTGESGLGSDGGIRTGKSSNRVGGLVVVNGSKKRSCPPVSVPSETNADED